jgi:hypothetical protein
MLLIQGRLPPRSEPSAIGPMSSWIEKLIEGPINAICDYEGRKASATRCVEIQNLSLTTRPLRTVAC